MTRLDIIILKAMDSSLKLIIFCSLLSLSLAITWPDNATQYKGYIEVRTDNQIHNFEDLFVVVGVRYKFDLVLPFYHYFSYSYESFVVYILNAQSVILRCVNNLFL